MESHPGKKSCAARTIWFAKAKVLYVGISDAPAWWIARANTLAELRGWTQFSGLQIEYSLMERTVERELIPMAKALNLGFSLWSRLARGVLSGKYHGEGNSWDAAVEYRLVPAQLESPLTSSR
jgi:aryl-alcohol dehydrogenase-like predicted oxidoreductase